MLANIIVPIPLQVFIIIPFFHLAVAGHMHLTKISRLFIYNIILMIEFDLIYIQIISQDIKYSTSITHICGSIFKSTKPHKI